jgi:chromosome segregation ATPase
MQKDHLEILLEDIRGKFDLVLEGHAALDKKIDVRFDDLNEKIEHNSFMIGALNKKIDSVDERLSKKIDAVEENLNKKIDAVDEKLSKKIDAVDEKLSKKIDAVDEKLSKKIDAVAADLSAHRADTEAHHGVYRVKEGE